MGTDINGSIDKPTTVGKRAVVVFGDTECLLLVEGNGSNMKFTFAANGYRKGVPTPDAFERVPIKELTLGDVYIIKKKPDNYIQKPESEMSADERQIIYIEDNQEIDASIFAWRDRYGNPFFTIENLNSNACVEVFNIPRRLANMSKDIDTYEAKKVDLARMVSNWPVKEFMNILEILLEKLENLSEKLALGGSNNLLVGLVVDYLEESVSARIRISSNHISTDWKVGKYGDLFKDKDIDNPTRFRKIAINMIGEALLNLYNDNGDRLLLDSPFARTLKENYDLILNITEKDGVLKMLFHQKRNNANVTLIYDKMHHVLSELQLESIK